MYAGNQVSYLLGGKIQYFITNFLFVEIIYGDFSHEQIFSRCFVY